MRPASRRYPGARVTSSSAGADAVGAIAPSMGHLGTGGLDCILGCICVQPEGCPCCDPVVIPPRLPQPSAPSADLFFRDLQARAWISCPSGTEEACTAVCDNHHGGMQSNPDGSMTCTIY